MDFIFKPFRYAAFVITVKTLWDTEFRIFDFFHTYGTTVIFHDSVL